MSVCVQKYGGTSLADPRRIRCCAERAAEAARNGDAVVVVVSAMGDTTDRLIDLASKITDHPNRREMDLLLTTGEQTSAALMTMAIQSLGVEAISFTGHHLGIITEPAHCRARIRSIDRQRLIEQLEFGRIVVAAGFQGVTEEGQITTLGRGGSDVTAVALAAALGVNDKRGRCEIYTDVDGVFTADPRIVAGARKLDAISYEEMLELSSLGAGVLHCRAAMFAQKYGVPLHVRHSEKPQEGTRIVKATTDMESAAVVGCALTRDLGKISVRGLLNRAENPDPGTPGAPSAQAVIFRHIADAGVLVDDIMQIETGPRADLSFTAMRDDLEELKAAVQRGLDELGEGEMTLQLGLAKVSVVGVGMRTHTGVASTMFSALATAGVGILNITTSEIKISCIVANAEGETALKALHEAFGLGNVLHEIASSAASSHASIPGHPVYPGDPGYPEVEIKPIASVKSGMNTGSY